MWQVNHEERTVTVEAGILLTEFNERLYDNGLAMSVLVHHDIAQLNEPLED